MRNLRDVVWAVCDEVGLPRPAVIAGSTDLTARAMLAFMNREGFELCQRSSGLGSWNELRKEQTFQLQATGVILGCSTTAGSPVITIGATATPPQAGWVLSTDGGSNATGFTYPSYVVSVVGSTVTMSNNSSVTSSNASFAFGQESYAMPDDYNYMINQTQWDRDKRWQVLGPLNPQEWQQVKSGLSPTGPRRRFRLMESKIFIDPIPADAGQITFEYYSKAFCTSSGGVAQTAFLADTDTPVLPDELFILGLKWRFLRSKGFDYAEEYKTYNDYITSLLGRNMAAKVLPLNNVEGRSFLISSNQIPDTGFGQ